MGIKLICVDDSATFRTILNLAFVGWSGARHVKVMAESAEVLTELQDASKEDDPYDVIILDIEMGPPNGIDLAKQIRLLSSYRTTPIYFLTSTEDKSLIDTAKLLGASVIHKNRRIGDALLHALTEQFGLVA